MAKCPTCKSRKGKRKCQLVGGTICSLCCGQRRSKEDCEGCIFYKETVPKKKYNEIPLYSPRDMNASLQLQDYSNAIEGSLCAFDNETGNQIKDEVAIRILELLLDNYHFKEEVTEFSDKITEQGFNHVKEVIETDLCDTPKEEIIKVLGAIRFVAKRRARGGRDYLSIIHSYVGERVAPGMRILPKGLFKRN
jgi:hypothetical protein